MKASQSSETAESRLNDRLSRYPFGWFLFWVLPIWGCLLFSLASWESLWLDELHTSWVLEGEWGSLWQRAAAGNQTIGYFIGLSPLCWTVSGLGGSSEVSVRLPSILASLGCLGLVGWVLRSHFRLAVIPTLLVLSWVGLDRLQLFYATEARVYAILQLISFIGWMFVGRIAASDRIGLESKNQSERVTNLAFVGWTLISGLAINLHLIALISVSLQMLVIAASSIFVPRDKRRRFVWSFAVSIAMLGSLSLPVVWLSQDVWSRREQWSVFAGDASLTRLASFYPLMPIMIPALLSVLAMLFFAKRGIAKPKERLLGAKVELMIWAFAALSPLVLGVAITSFGIAPLMHARYLLAAAMPLVILGGGVLSFLERPWLQNICGVITLGWLMWLQGTVGMWQQGYLVGPLRGEGWRQAIEYVETERVSQQAIGKANSTVWCYGGLIEASAVELPMSHAETAYLSFPLRGIYQVSGRKLALVGTADAWAEIWGNYLEAEQVSSADFWIVRRGFASGLRRELRDLEHLDASEATIEITHFGDVRSFGRIAVARISVRSAATEASSHAVAR